MMRLRMCDLRFEITNHQSPITDRDGRLVYCATMSTVTPSHVEKSVARSLMLIGGKAVESADGRYRDIGDDATRAVMGELPGGGEGDIESAVRAASVDFVEWKRVTPKDGGRMLVRIADVAEAETESIARRVRIETGNAVRTHARPESK